MPIYEYECTSCRTVIEVFQRMTEDPLTTCPDCSGPIKKLVSMSSFQLKGGGWYADGYNNGSCNASDSTSKKDEAVKASDKSDKATDKATANSTDSSKVSKSDEGCAATT